MSDMFKRNIMKRIVVLGVLTIGFATGCSDDDPVRERDRCTPREHGIELPITEEDMRGTWGECTVCDPDCPDNFVFEACHFFDDGTMVMLDPDTFEPLSNRVPYELELGSSLYRIKTPGHFRPHTMMRFFDIASSTELGVAEFRITALNCPASPAETDGAQALENE